MLELPDLACVKINKPKPWQRSLIIYRPQSTNVSVTDVYPPAATRFGEVAGVAALGWPGLVIFLAVVPQSRPHPFCERRQQAVAVPILQRITRERLTGAAALIGQDSDLVHLLREHPVIAGANTHFYLTTAVLTTKMISLLVDGVSGIDLCAQLDATGVAGVKASTSRAGTAQVRLESDVALAFAVELYELEFVPATDGVRLRRTVVPVRVRNGRRVVNRERLVPAEIGGPDGDLFI